MKDEMFHIWEILDWSTCCKDIQRSVLFFTDLS